MRAKLSNNTSLIREFPYNSSTPVYEVYYKDGQKKTGESMNKKTHKLNLVRSSTILMKCL